MRILFVGLAATVVAASAFCGLVYWSNVRALERTYPVARVSIPVVSGPDAIARGRKLADITGCSDCHGADLRGRLFIDEGWLHGRYYASNLTLKAQAYSDEDLARIVRLGVRPDGRGVVVMPSMGFVRLTDDEMADLLAHVRSLPAGGSEQPTHWIGPLDHWELWRAVKLKPSIAYVETERRKIPAAAGPGNERGRHLAGIVCAECHGGDLRGNGWDSGAPDLAIAAAYGPAQFEALLRTGAAVGGRKLGLMGTVAKDRLHKLSDDDISAIYGYLIARSKLPR